MCTAVSYFTDRLFFGRTLDHDRSYGESVVFVPRRAPLEFRMAGSFPTHYAMLGMAHVAGEYPLFYDAFNEKGLCIAGLNFVGNAAFFPKGEGNNVAQFELVPWILGQCASVAEAEALLKKTNLIDLPFSEDFPSARLHYLIADKERTVTVEFTKDGLNIYENFAGVLTNNPPFPLQRFRLNDYLSLSPKQPKSLFSKELGLSTYSLGMGAIGLPGDGSSTSRFVRAAFVRNNSKAENGEEAGVNQFFHILGAVDQPRGTSETENGGYEMTVYTSCMSTESRTYYYTTYSCHTIKAVKMAGEDMEGDRPVVYPVSGGEEIKYRN